MNKILAISEVIPIIQNGKVGFRDTILTKSGIKVKLSSSLVRIAKLNQPLECSICGCIGTYMMQGINNHEDGHHKDDSWKIMSWNKERNRPTFLTIDHIVPKHFGGTLVPQNCRIACHFCNSQRGTDMNNVEVPENVPIYHQAYSLTPALEFIRNKLQNVITITKNQFKKVKEVVRDYLTGKSQSYRRATNKNHFREAIKRGLAKVGIMNLSGSIIDTIVEAGVITL